MQLQPNKDGSFKWFTVNLMKEESIVFHSSHWGTEILVPNVTEKEIFFIKRVSSKRLKWKVIYWNKSRIKFYASPNPIANANKVKKTPAAPFKSTPRIILLHFLDKIANTIPVIDKIPNNKKKMPAFLLLRKRDNIIQIPTISMDNHPFLVILGPH